MGQAKPSHSFGAFASLLLLGIAGTSEGVLCGSGLSLVVVRAISAELGITRSETT